MQSNKMIKKQDSSLFTILFLFMLMLASANADFIRDDNTQIVTDTRTGLQWQDNIDAKTITKHWMEAIAYCEDLTLGGYDDWRLPNFNELYYLADKNKGNPTISSVFENVASNDYWTSTSVVGNESGAFNVNFCFGVSNWGSKTGTGSSYVRCVRGGQ